MATESEILETRFKCIGCGSSEIYMSDIILACCGCGEEISEQEISFHDECWDKPTFTCEIIFDCYEKNSNCVAVGQSCIINYHPLEVLEKHPQHWKFQKQSDKS